MKCAVCRRAAVALVLAALAAAAVADFSAPVIQVNLDSDPQLRWQAAVRGVLATHVSALCP
jgi:hypothetical protein